MRLIIATIGLSLILAAVTSPGWSAVVYVDDSSGAPFSTPTGAWSAVGSNDQIRNEMSFTTSAGASALFSPGLATGSYNVQAYWRRNAVSGTLPVVYTIKLAGGATTTVNVDQELRASQGGGIGMPGGSSSSGWYTLGTFQLDSASNVTLNRVSNTATDQLNADAIRFSNQDQIVDERAASMSFYSDDAQTSPGGWAEDAVPTTNADESHNYAYKGGPSAGVAVYKPGLDGPRQVSISWGARTDGVIATYTVDLDGPGGAAPLAPFTIDQTKLADQITPSAGDQWSGFYSLGVLQLTANTTITLDSSAASGIFTADALLLSNPLPEPGSVAVMLVAAAGGMMRWRRTSCN